MDKNITIIEERIYTMRIKMHLTQQELANRLGV